MQCIQYSKLVGFITVKAIITVHSIAYNVLVLFLINNVWNKVSRDDLSRK